ncbi:uncharacterized protein HD556DRAFT_1309155 [Suillus plorans]|uniref:Uncharacterized protein n=1 Tax=Suillus plorans TaxID=116603 RepID=A0A9P7DH86_9AGAM|nr:uncharacterized protein HD556DRAFT_1309155 [Suillus plorans]KAG1792605.1 hypothetical protein HD556DRAFT_1309155 [Suillus plorans]
MSHTEEKFKESVWLAATGIGTVVCARHNFKRPSAKREKYINIDYLFFLIMSHLSKIVIINISYDIIWMTRMDSNIPECGWSNINSVATSTWEMGPGSRCDVLDDHFGDWNWWKMSNFGAIPSESLTIWCMMVKD